MPPTTTPQIPFVYNCIRPGSAVSMISCNGLYPRGWKHTLPMALCAHDWKTEPKSFNIYTRFSFFHFPCHSPLQKWAQFPPDSPPTYHEGNKWLLISCSLCMFYHEGIKSLLISCSLCMFYHEGIKWLLISCSLCMFYHEGIKSLLISCSLYVLSWRD